MKVYIVTTGNYSDYQVRSVHLDRAKAEHILALLDDADGQVREYTIDEWYRPGRFVFEVFWSRDKATSKETWDTSLVTDDDRLRKWTQGETSRSTHGNCVVEASDPQHALKIGSEYRRQWLIEQDLAAQQRKNPDVDEPV